MFFIMDEKGLKKIVQVITVILKLKEEGKITTQGFNDRISVAKEIYQRNKGDKEFVETLNREITSEMEELFELISN